MLRIFAKISIDNAQRRAIVLAIGATTVPQWNQMKTYTYSVYSFVLKKTYTHTRQFASGADFRLYACSLWSGNWSLISVE